MAEIPDLVFNFFKLCELKPLEIRKGIYQVQITDALAKELDGWRAKGGLFQFTFDKRLAETYGAELISQGSYRLDSIIRAIRKQGILSHGFLCHDVFFEPSIRRKLLSKLELLHPEDRFYVLDHQLKYGPYLWFTISITYLAYEKCEEIRTIPVDLLSGKVVNYSIPIDLLQPGTPDESRIYRRKLSYKRAYQNLQSELTEQLKYQDPTWAQEAEEYYLEEYHKLEVFYQDMPESSDREQRQSELKYRAKPQVQVRPLRGAFLYLPKLEYRIMHVGNQEKINRIIYDPVSNLWNIA